MTTHRSLLVTMTIGLLLSASTQAGIINVPDDQPTIQAAIEVALDGDEIIVAPKTYFENINFLHKAISVRSIDPTDPAVVAGTTINGGGSGSVVTCDSGEGPDTVLSGFVITNGNTSGDGGGMRILDSSPTVSHCRFVGNTATGSGVGGGMFSSGGSPAVSNCTFSGNAAGLGGGLLNLGFDSCMTVTDCTFNGNTANFGGGMLNLGVSACMTVSNCTLSGNTVNVAGGGLYNTGGSPTVGNCQICDNTPDQVSGPYTDGGGNLIADECPLCILADLSGNGVVDATDLAILLGNWGSCDDPCEPGDPAHTCAADFSGDCIVDAADLAMLLGAWGMCP